MARRLYHNLAIAFALIVFFTVSFWSPLSTTPRPSDYDVHGEKHEGPAQAQAPLEPPASEPGFSVDVDLIPTAALEGDSIAPKLENATLK